MEYIDLGLPSGNLWAAENEEGYYTFDEAVAKFGDCLPTKDDFEELLEHCWKRWDNERKGLEFMGDNGAKIFLPASGFRNGSDVGNMQGNGYYWSATPFGSLNPKAKPTGWQQTKYGALPDQDWHDVLANGFSECFSVLKPGGFLIFKWNETDIPVREVLKLTDQKPIFGHKSGKRSNTHWICFMKS